MNFKHFSLLLCLILTLSHPVSAETNDFINIKKHLLAIKDSAPQLYRVKLEGIMENAKDHGTPFAHLIIVAINIGASLDTFIAAALKAYPADEIVLAAITSGGDPFQIIKDAIFSGGDPTDVQYGAEQAGIPPVEASIMVTKALNLFSGKENAKNDKKLKDEEGDGTAPGDGAGGLPGGDGLGPVGGDGGGFASPS